MKTKVEVMKKEGDSFPESFTLAEGGDMIAFPELEEMTQLSRKLRKLMVAHYGKDSSLVIKNSGSILFTKESTITLAK